MKATIDTPKRGLPLRCDALVRLFMVLWDDEQGLCVPMMWDEDCEGALCGGAVRSIDRVAIFADRKAARKAIDISAKWNALRKAQGHVYNSDFEGDSRKCLRVVECKPNVQDQTPAAQDSADTATTSSRLSASVLFVLGCSWWFLF